MPEHPRQRQDVHPDLALDRPDRPANCVLIAVIGTQRTLVLEVGSAPATISMALSVYTRYP